MSGNVSHFIVDLANGKSYYRTKLIEGIERDSQRIKPKYHHTDLLIQMLLFMVACSSLLFHRNGCK